MVGTLVDIAKGNINKSIIDIINSKIEKLQVKQHLHMVYI